eukprot:m.83879 g.83879  ORF g.83879 m.83879 type:complete len:52 (-) comp12730_c0_seq2:1490-1645(-)
MLRELSGVLNCAATQNRPEVDCVTTHHAPSSVYTSCQRLYQLNEKFCLNAS